MSNIISAASNPYLSSLILFISVYIIGLLVFLYMKRKKSKKNSGLEIYTQATATPTYYRSIYRFLCGFALTRSICERVRSRYEMIEPGNIEKIERDTVRSVLTIFGLTIGVSVGFALFQISLYSILLIAYSIYCISLEYLSFSTKKKKRLLLSQLHTELEHLQSNYNHAQDVCDALFETSVNAPDPVRSHLLTIWHILQEDELHINTAVERYNITSPLPYLKDLLACSKETMEYGDNYLTGISNYTHQLTGIMNSTAADERITDHATQGFKGHAFMALVPVYLKPVANKFVLHVFDVDDLIHGTYGIISTVLIFVISFAIYNVILRKSDLSNHCARYHSTLQRLLKIPLIRYAAIYLKDKNQERKNRIQTQIHKIGESLSVEQFMVQRILFAVAGFLLTCFVCLFITYNTRSTVLTKETGISTKITEGTTAEEEENIKQFIIDTSVYLKNEKIDDPTAVSQMVSNSGLFYSDSIESLCVDEILGRVYSYNHAYFRFWYLLLALGCGFAISYTPYFLLQRNKTLVLIQSNDEVMRFNVIISCMKSLKRASSKGILEELELSADIFRNSITECVDEFASDPMQALEHFQYREKDNPMIQQLCAKLIRADRIGIFLAFANLEAEMEEWRKAREQKCTYYIDNASALTSALSFVPIFVVIILEMAVPMALGTFSQMSIMNQMM